MPRIVYVILYSCLIVFAGLLVRPAHAGSHDDGYYRDVTYRPHHVSRVWYSSNCCYRKIVRHVRQVRYVKVPPPPKKKARLRLHRQYREYGDYDRPRYRVSHYDLPPRYVDDGGYVVRRDRCHHRRVRVLSGDGGWMWALRARCD
jgi:hypothetical protein